MIEALTQPIDLWLFILAFGYMAWSPWRVNDKASQLKAERLDQIEDRLAQLEN
jgi:hypothetical protein